MVDVSVRAVVLGRCAVACSRLAVSGIVIWVDGVFWVLGAFVMAPIAFLAGWFACELLFGWAFVPRRRNVRDLRGWDWDD